MIYMCSSHIVFPGFPKYRMKVISIMSICTCSFIFHVQSFSVMLMYLYCFTANTISFGQPVYIITEKNELAVDLVLSNSLSVNVTVHINTDDFTATGKDNVPHYQ